jgi:hypothetical protein
VDKSLLKHRLAAIARVGAVLAAVAVVSALPFDWVRVGHTATLLAAGLQQPHNAAQVLGERLSTDDTAQSEAVMAPPSAATNAEDHTAVLSPTETPSVPAVAPPKADGSGGKIVEQKLDTGDTRKYGIAMRNSSGKAVDIAAALATKLTPKFTDTDAPQVLIIHTHTTETYMTYDAGYYNASDRERTANQARNVCAVGDAMVRTLAAHGIAAIHDTTVHDAPLRLTLFRSRSITSACPSVTTGATLTLLEPDAPLATENFSVQTTPSLTSASSRSAASQWTRQPLWSLPGLVMSSALKAAPFTTSVSVRPEP